MVEARLIAGRYRVVRPLGRGGNAQVHEVVDEAKDVRVALKSLSREDAAGQHRRDLFEREFNTLSQLAHPLVVRVFDYGVDETPYYTMELIAGSRLRGRFPWAEACALLRDVASALSLVHSRRLVHRDVTHRNVYKTEDGHAKLFDFGALTPMGSTMDVVGTPPFMAPEAVAESRLDARSDLFSLGALGYVLLTERHAFAARSVAELGEAWKRPVPPPSHFAPDVPKPLDDLIVSLLSLDAAGRPASAAEVFNRLTAIASLPPSEAPEVAEAYLTTPALVGRTDATRRFRHVLTRASRQRGMPLVIEGGSGLGRSRLLSSFLMSAKLEGILTLRADAATADEGPFGVGVTLARRLFAVDPATARDAAGPHAELLAPLLFPGASSGAFSVRNEGRSATLVEALSSMFIAAAEAHALVIGVDDFERLDSHSKEFVVRLAALSRKSKLTLAIALSETAASEAHLLLRDVASSVTLLPLSEPETKDLVRSLFGEVANIDAVSRWVHDLSGGRPRAALEVANHLVETGMARFEEGLWILPSRLDPRALPASLDQALDAKLASLGADAAGLCRALALSSEQDPLLLREYAALVEGVTGARLDAAINELVGRSILVPVAMCFAFTHGGVREAARRGIPEGELPNVHRRVAAAYGSGATPSLALSAHHSLMAGDVETAFTLSAHSVSRRTTISQRGSAFLRTAEGTRPFERLFEWGIRNEKPWPETLALGQTLLQLAAVSDMTLVRHMGTVLERLRADSGLADYDRLSSSLSPLDRIKTAIEAARARHDATPEKERGLSPSDAIGGLCGAVASLSGVFSRRGEPLEVAKLARLLEPFRPVAPAAAVVADMAAFSVDGLLGRSVRPRRLRCIETLSRPLPGLDEVPRIGMYWMMLFYEALDEAANGQAFATLRVEPLMQNAIYAPLAWEVRMVVALFQGDVATAEAARRERDLSHLAGSTDVEAELDMGLLYEAGAADFLGDVLRLKPLVAWLEERARRYPATTAQYELQLGNYHRLRGELPKALAAYQRALSLAPSPSEFGDWSYVAVRLGQALLDSGRPEEARAFCASALSEAVSCDILPRMQHLIEMALATAEAALGLGPAAVARSERIVKEATEQELDGILFVTLCKDQGKVAVLLRDEPLLERVIARLEAIAGRSQASAFATKHAHLLRHALGREHFQVLPNPQKVLGGTTSTLVSPAEGVRTQIELCRGRGERARKALRLLLDAAQADEGFLYLCGGDTVSLAASSAGRAPPASLDAALFEHLRAGSAEGDTTGDREEDSVRLRSLRPLADEPHFDVIEMITQSDGRCVLAGLAALKPRNRVLEPVPLLLRQALSDALISAGDTSGIQWV